MRKVAFALAALAAVCLTTTADAAKKKAAAAKPDPAMAAQENTAKFMGAAVNPWQAKDAAMPAKKVAKKSKKKKAKKA